MNLSDLQIGEKGRILSIKQGDKSYRQRLLAMGLVPGTIFEIARLAPLGDPVEISVRGYALSLRLGEAQILQVERA